MKLTLTLALTLGFGCKNRVGSEFVADHTEFSRRLVHSTGKHVWERLEEADLL